jgi:hypothetical protein
MQDDVEQIEISIAEAEKLVARRDMLNRLRKNPDFIAVFDEGYLKEEAVRLVSLLAEPAMAAHKSEVMTALEAISRFRQYLSAIFQMGNAAAREIAEGRETIADIHAEHGVEFEAE